MHSKIQYFHFLKPGSMSPGNPLLVCQITLNPKGSPQEASMKVFLHATWHAVFIAPSSSVV